MKDPVQLIKDALRKNLPKFGGIRIMCTYRDMGASSYDSNTGVVTKPYTDYTAIPMIWDELQSNIGYSGTKKEDDTTILEIDKAVLFFSEDLAVKPAIGDIVIDPDLVQWVVRGIANDPAIAMYKLHLRPIS